MLIETLRGSSEFFAYLYEVCYCVNIMELTLNLQGVMLEEFFK